MEGWDWVDMQLVGYTVSDFPQSRTLAANEADEAPLVFGIRTSVSSAGYDPAFLLPFCCQVLQITFISAHSSCWMFGQPFS